MPVPVYGLTGGIASGKSAAFAYFQSLGIDCIDTDVLARGVIAPGTAGQQDLLAAIGPQFFDAGELNRQALRDAMYKDPALKQAVEHVIHPKVKDAVDRWRRQSSPSPYRILCSPLLLETGAHAALDGVIVVDVPLALQQQRGSARDLRTPAEIAAVMAHQMDRERRLALATHVLDNQGSLDDLHQQINQLHQELRHE